jgi:c-di-GMP-binding flagellar brake protein YcgR
LDVSVYNKKINVIDISLGGIKFSFDKDLQLEANQVIEVRLGMAGAAYTVQARILRTWEAENERIKKELRFAAAGFLNVSGRIEQELSRKILDIQREAPFTLSEA